MVTGPGDPRPPCPDKANQVMASKVRDTVSKEVGGDPEDEIQGCILGSTCIHVNMCTHSTLSG